MSSADFFERVAMRGDHLPEPGAVVRHGEARFTVLTPRLLRIEWAPDGDFDDRPSYAFPSRRAAVPAFHTAVSQGALCIDTGALVLSYAGGPGPLSPANLRVSFQVDGREVIWTPGATDPENLRGARRTLDGCRGEAALEPGLISRSGWSLHDDSAAVRFDPASGWVAPALPGPRQDWYLFAYGHDYPAALAEYARFGGAVPMIPRWALGAWWSRYWAYSERDLRELVAEFAARDLPLDVLVIDMDWHLPGYWTGYSWNRELFPDPAGFLAWLHEQGLRTTLNLHPADGVGSFEEAYPDFARAMGVDPASGAGIPFKISDAAFAERYFALLHHPLEDQGVDFWWMDWQQGRESELPGLDPLPWLNHLHFQDMRRRSGMRPMVFSRWGGLGNHRYPIGFSGDTYATWEALRFQPYFTANAANVLYGWWSHDIGGHFAACEPELYARWVQLGALGPILRLHSTNDPTADRRPWAFPEPVFAAARAAFHERYRLLPYLYTLARIHADQSIAPCRPMYYLAPADESAYTAREQYMLGDQLLVAPIVHRADPASGLAPADVWVPAGEWIERSSGELFVGPKWHRLVGDLDGMPQLVRAGGILPLAAVAQRSHGQPPSELTLSVFPGEHGELLIYEDDGLSEEYRRGQHEWTRVTLQASGGKDYVITIGAVEGRCEALPARRRLSVRLEHVGRPRDVAVSGAEGFEWRYDEALGAVLVELPHTPKDAPLSMTISAAEPLSLATAARSAELRAADARRLLGLPEAQASAGLDALVDAALDAGGPAGAAALARLGGPFARVYEYTTPEDASRRLGRLLIVAPQDGSPLRARGTWRLLTRAGLREEPLEIDELLVDRVIDCPFVWDGSVSSARWELDLRLEWRGRSIEQHFASQTLFPTVGAGRLLARRLDNPLAVEELIDADGAPRPELPWEPFAHTPAHGEFQNLTERYNIPLSAHAVLNRGSDMVGYVAVTLRSPEARSARIAAQSYRPLRLILNGEPLPIESQTENDMLKLNYEWSRSAPAGLRPGDNHLLVICEHKGEELAWRWFLHLMVADDAGQPMPDVVVVP